MFIQHLLEQIKLSHCHHHNSQQLDHSEILNLVLVFSDDLRMDLLPLLLEVLILGDLLESLSDIDQLGMQLVDLALLGEFQEVSLIVRVKIY